MRRRALLAWGAVGAVALTSALVVLLVPKEPRRPPPEALEVTPLEEVEVDFVHAWTGETYPFLGAAAIDADGDGRLEVFVGGGAGQEDALLSFSDGRLADLGGSAGLSRAKPATYGVSAVDLDADGRTDLLAAREDGLWLHRNTGAGFEARRLELGLEAGAVPLCVSVSDYDQDGDGDLYVGTFVARDRFDEHSFEASKEAPQDRLLRNEGGLRFVDVTEEAGVGEPRNTFAAVWVDLNLDGRADLVVAPNAGRVVAYDNRGGGRLERLGEPTPFGYWTSATFADIDADGDQDLFFTNAGARLPAFVLKGDLPKGAPFSSSWLLLENLGGFRFADVTEAYGLDGYGYARGADFAELDFDGFADLVVAQGSEEHLVSAVEYLRPPNKAFLSHKVEEEGRRRFFDVRALGLDSKAFGASPLFVDLDADGRPDVFMPHPNRPARAYLNRSEARTFTVALPDAGWALGTQVYLQTDEGRTATKVLRSSTGFLTDSAPELVFGVGRATRILKVFVYWPGQTTPQLYEGGLVGMRRVITRPQPPRPDAGVEGGGEPGAVR